MGYLLNREFVNDRLRIPVRQSYRLIPAWRNSLINSDDLLALLNRCRVRVNSTVTSIPHDLMTAEELAQVPELAHTGLTAHRIMCMARRKVKVPPHFRLGRATLRFSRRLFLDWLSNGR